MPRKSRRKQNDEPTPVAETLETIAQKHGLKPASESLRPLDPPSVAPPADEPANVQSFRERVRPDGPKKRPPGEPRGVFVSVSGGFRLTEKDQVERAFEFSDALPPGEAEKRAMHDAGLQYRTRGKRWAAEATPEVRDATDRLALEFSGKDIGRGR